jgi:predicted nicotinamide N-methyase
MRWLTALVNRAPALFGDEDDRALVLSERATHLLSHLMGTEDFRSRVIRIPSPHVAAGHIEFTLRDGTVNEDHSSLGMQTWGSAIVLMEMIARSPQDFFPRSFGAISRPLRILELGAGTGLVTLALAKLFMALLTEARNIPIELVATDFHPDVIANLRDNVSSNLLHSSDPWVSVSVHKLDWQEYENFDLQQTNTTPFEEPFDVVIGADIVYDSRHAAWIRSTVAALLRKPRNEEVDPTFWLITPLRHTHIRETSSIDDAFPMATSMPHQAPPRLVISSVKEVEHAAFERHTQDATYRLCAIKWSS